MTDSEQPASPVVIHAPKPRCQVEPWVADHREELHRRLVVHGAVLLRGFEHQQGLESISRAMSADLLPYMYRSTPRVSVGDRIYTATEYPARESIPQHSENAYQRVWPRILLFHCAQAAAKGGATPLARLRDVTAAIDRDVVEEFAAKGVRYVRNYRAGLDLPWQDVFGTQDKHEVEAFCRRSDMECTWSDDGLRTSQVCQAVARHPETAERVWFNQAHLFHVSALSEQARQVMMWMFGESRLPRNATFGDGSAIPQETLVHVRGAFERNLIRFDWQTGDFLLVDNMQLSHGRDPFEGPRRVFVCMWQPCNADGYVC